MQPIRHQVTICVRNLYRRTIVNQMLQFSFLFSFSTSNKNSRKTKHINNWAKKNKTHDNAKSKRLHLSDLKKYLVDAKMFIRICNKCFTHIEAKYKYLNNHPWHNSSNKNYINSKWRYWMAFVSHFGRWNENQVPSL